MLQKLIKAYRKPGVVTPAMNELLKYALTHEDLHVRAAAQAKIAKALTTPLENAIFHGDVVSSIYERKDGTPGQLFMWPKSFVTSDNDDQFDAFVLPAYGEIPDRQVKGDYIAVPTFRYGNGMSVSLSYAESAGWPVIQTLTAKIVEGHIRTRNRLGFETLLAAAAARNFVVNDSQATAGLFTKRLVTLAAIKMARLGGGNSASTNRRRLTDIYFSLEGQGDMRNWDLTQVDDITRREIYVADDMDETLNKVFNIYLHPMDEFGENQVYQNYITRATTHGGLATSLPNSKLEFALGLDLRNRDSFIMPVNKDVQVKPDPYMDREDKFGLYSKEEYGLGVLDNRNAMLLAF